MMYFGDVQNGFMKCDMSFGVLGSRRRLVFNIILTGPCTVWDFYVYMGG